MVTNGQHGFVGRGDSALSQIKRGAGSQHIGACVAPVKADQRLSVVCAFLSVVVPTAARASTDMPKPAASSFAYSISHTAKPLPETVIDKITDPSTDGFGDDSQSLLDANEQPLGRGVVMPRQLSRTGLCSAVASVARANNLPIPFFANLIWQESSFNSKTISSAGAQGIAQFMPKTAVQFGLINPFEPIHALNVAGKFVRELYAQFGNLGLAAAAYNAGPRRVSDWMAKRGALPSETRNYVIKITGRPADQWATEEIKNNPEAALMPAQAPCVEVAEAVKAQTKTVRMAKLMQELTAAATSVRDNKDDLDLDAAAMATVADAGWRSRALRMVNGVLQRMTAKVGRKALTKMAAKSASQPAIKVAMLELSLSDNSVFDKDEAKAARAPGVARLTGQREAKLQSKLQSKSQSKQDVRSAARGSAKDPRAPRPADEPKTLKTTGAASTRSGAVTSKSGSDESSDERSPRLAKAEAPKSEPAKSGPSKHSARRHHRGTRRTTVASSNLDQVF